jgi:hypothetical protein
MTHFDITIHQRSSQATTAEHRGCRYHWDIANKSWNAGRQYDPPQDF